MDVTPAMSNSLLCPSAQPDWEGSVVLGVVSGSVEEPRIAYLTEPQPVTDELLALTQPVAPTEILRFAAPCAGHACRHFDGANCRLVMRTVQILPKVVDVLPACRLRSKCRWWQQEGKAACMRCPQVVTDSRTTSEHVIQAATPDNGE